MSRFLVTYHGGSGPPADAAQEEQIKAAFGAWLGRAGSAVVDPGAPLRFATQLANGEPTPMVPIGGYTIVEAPDAEAAAAVLRDHPFVGRGGTLQVDQAMT